MATESTTDNIFSGLRVVDFASFIAGAYRLMSNSSYRTART